MEASQSWFCCWGGEKCMALVERLAKCPATSCLMLLLAGLTVLRILLRLLCAAKGAVMRRARQGSCSNLKGLCIVTGATDGIGKALSLQLAKDGVRDFLLVGRSAEKLSQTEKELRGAGAASARSVVIDLAVEEVANVEKKVLDAVGGDSVGILVNNAGVSYPHAKFFEELEVCEIEQLVNVNFRSLLAITHAILPTMKKQRYGLVVCIGSGSSMLPSDPFYSAYAASKAAVETFCESLRVECAPFGVKVQCQVPLLVTTKLAKCKTATFTTPSQHKYAESAVRFMDVSAGGSACESGTPTTVSPYWVHRLLLGVITATPTQLWNSFRYKQCADLRRRALAKKDAGKKDS